MHESHLRSVVKGISWRLNATFITIVISFLITGRADLAISIGAFEFVVKIFWYYLHERFWLAVNWGKLKRG